MIPVLCYGRCARPEDRARLRSDPSAEAGGYTVGPCDEHGLPLREATGSQESGKPWGFGGGAPKAGLFQGIPVGEFCSPEPDVISPRCRTGNNA